MKLFLTMMVFAIGAAAAEAPPAQLMQEMAGVYKHRFKSGIVTPGKAPMEADTVYVADDIVEIVPHDDTHVYVRAELQCYNGTMRCHGPGASPSATWTACCNRANTGRRSTTCGNTRRRCRGVDGDGILDGEQV